MIFALVSILIFAAVATLAVGMLIRRKERDTKEVTARVGGRKSKSAATGPLIAERDTPGFLQVQANNVIAIERLLITCVFNQFLVDHPREANVLILGEFWLELRFATGG